MLDLEACWTAVENRDAAADGNFFYGVRTTGVYCRPGCASRRPLRANTVFFETTAAAESAGFRSCKRCRPTDESAAKLGRVSWRSVHQPLSLPSGVQADHRCHPA
jgi:AraC family transcriptional regulator of adaptative response/methylated-DNA-[protein]-cysteine methyltransferase